MAPTVKKVSKKNTIEKGVKKRLFKLKLYKGFDKLTPGKYLIEQFRLVKSKFPTENVKKTLLIELTDQVS